MSTRFILTCAVFATLIVLLMYWRTRHQTTLEKRFQFNENKAISFRARDESGSNPGILYVSDKGIRFVLPSSTAFDLSLDDIEKVTYSNRSVQIATKQGIVHIVRYLRDGPNQENAIISTATYAQMAHQRPALNNFLVLMQQLEIPAEKGDIAESVYFEKNAIIGIIAMSAIVVLAIAHFVFGLDSFLGINL